MLKATRTFATLEVSKQTYEEIAGKLREAGYDHAFLPSHDTIGIDMNGICLTVTREALARQRQNPGGREFAPGDVVEVRYLPGQKEWERATYVRRIRKDEMPALWRGALGHVVERADKRHTSLSGHRIRKFLVTK